MIAIEKGDFNAYDLMWNAVTWRLVFHWLLINMPAEVSKGTNRY